MQQAIASTVGVPIGERKRAVAKAATSCCRDEASTAACLRVLFEELLSVDESNGESNGELPCGNAASNTNSNAAVATSTINSDPVEWKRAVCSLLANVCREQDVTDLTAVDGCDEAMCVFLDSKQHDTAHHRTRRAAFHALVTSLHPATALWTRYACRSIDWLLAAYRQDVVEDMRDAVLTLKTAVATVARWIASVHQSVQLNVDENATLSIWLADTVSSLITSFNAAAMGSDAQYLCALVLVQLLEVLHVVEERVLHTVEERSGHFYDDNALVALLVTVLGQVAQHYDTSSATNDIDRRLSWMVMFRTALSGWRYNATCLLEPMSGLNDDTPSMKTRPCLFISLVLPMLAGIAIAPLDVPRRMLVADTLLASMQYQRTHSSHPAVLELWGESSTGADSQVTLTTLRCTLIDDVIWKWMVASDMTYYVQQRLRMSLEAACAIAERVQTSSRPCPFVENMARRTLGLPVHCKTRYLILRVLVGPLNASALIQLHPNLLGECVQALRHSESAGPAIDVFVETVVQLKPSTKDLNAATIDAWLDIWRKHYLRALCDSDKIVRTNASELSKALLRKVFTKPAPILDIVDRLLPSLLHDDAQNTSAAVVALLSTARILNLQQTALDMADLRTCLRTAIDSADLDVRIDAIAYVCTNAGDGCAGGVHHETLALVRLILEHSCNVMDSAFRNQMVQHLVCWLEYVGVRLKRALKDYAVRGDVADAGGPVATIDDTAAFFEWLGTFVITQLVVPGATYCQLHIGLSIVETLFSTFGTAPESHINRFLSPVIFDNLLSLQLDGFSASRAMVSQIMVKLRDPLFASSNRDVKELGRLARALLCNPRASECEGGAVLLNLVSLHECDRRVLEEGLSMATVAFQAVVSYTDEVEACILAAEKDVNVASRSNPLHGKLVALRTLLANVDFQSDEVAPTLPAFIDRLYAVAQNASNVVIGLLTDESPEGHLPDDDLDDGGALCLDSDVLAQKSKLVMGHAWCTMREISRLLTTLLERLDDTTQTAVSIPRGTLLSMGAFLHTLLTTVRHVGAYWAVAAVFGVFCNKLMASNDVNVRSLLARWLVDLLRSVDNLSSLLSITRRSGGLPFAITAILLAESNVKLRSQSLLTLDAAVAMGGGVLEDDQSSATVFPPPLSYPSRPLLSVTMDHLFDIAQRPLSQSDIAENKTDLQQVHAFNILRAVFQDNHLGPEAQRWVVGGVELAILGFNSPCWAIRNCAVMLYSTLCVRIFGARPNQTRTNRALTTHDFFKKYEDLYFFMRKALFDSWYVMRNPRSTRDLCRPVVFPIMSMLAKLSPASGPGNAEMPLEPLAAHVRVFALYCCMDPIRRVAATVFVSLTPRNATAVETECRKLLEELALPWNADEIAKPLDIKHDRENARHGRLLVLNAFLRYYGRPVCGYTAMREVALGANPLVYSEEEDLDNQDMLDGDQGPVDATDDELAMSLRKLLQQHCGTLYAAIGDPERSAESGSLAAQLVHDFMPAPFRNLPVTDLLRQLDMPSIGGSIRAANITTLLTRYALERKPAVDEKLLAELVTHTASYEVQLVALDRIRHASAPVSAHLSEKLWNVASDVATDHRVRAASLRIIARTTSTLQVDHSMDVNVVMTLADTKTLPLSLRCAAFEMAGRLCDAVAIDRYGGLLLKMSDADTQLPLRRSCLLSLDHFLKGSVALDAATAFAMFIDVLAFRLLHDDDEDIRVDAARISCTVLGVHPPCSNYSASERLAHHVMATCNTGDIARLFAQRLMTWPVVFAADSSLNVLFPKENPNSYKAMLVDQRLSAWALMQMCSDDAAAAESVVSCCSSAIERPEMQTSWTSTHRAILANMEALRGDVLKCAQKKLMK